MTSEVVYGLVHHGRVMDIVKHVRSAVAIDDRLGVIARQHRRILYDRRLDDKGRNRILSGHTQPQIHSSDHLIYPASSTYKGDRTYSNKNG